MAAAAVSVVAFNLLFIAPRFTLAAYGKEYPVTFLIMFLTACLSGNLAARLKSHARESAQTTYRTKVLFDTDQLLARAGDRAGRGGCHGWAAGQALGARRGHLSRARMASRRCFPPRRSPSPTF